MQKKSLWQEDVVLKSHPQLVGDMSAEIVIIGGGMAGVLTAYMLKQAGKDPIIIEANSIGSGSTGRTTAKLTVQHRLVYSELAEKLSNEVAADYAAAQLEALSEYKHLIKVRGIDCDYKECTAYVYTTTSKYGAKLKKECDIANSLGINADLVNEINLPLKVHSAVRFFGQGRFNPLKFLANISEDLRIFENTKALEIKDKTIITEHGSITAEKIIFTSRYPFVNIPGFYFARMHQERAYLIAFKDAKYLSDIYIDADPTGNTFRSYGEYTIIGGESHRTGKNDKFERYNNILSLASELYPNCKPVYAWSAQDCITPDSIPYIGDFSEGSDGIYVATGFNKWGMTNSMVAAKIISGAVLGNTPHYAKTFSPSRFHITDEIAEIAKNGILATSGIIDELIGVPAIDVADLPLGHGGIVVAENRKVGVYKDKEGIVYAVDARCPHLGCQLAWNPDEKSWDCPCHGSRYDFSGKLLDGPSTQSDLARYSIVN